MDHNECSSVWKTDGFLAACCRIIGASGLEYILTRKCPLPFFMAFRTCVRSDPFLIAATDPQAPMY
jgi:hypothetical protein